MFQRTGGNRVWAHLSNGRATFSHARWRVAGDGRIGPSISASRRFTTRHDDVTTTISRRARVKFKFNLRTMVHGFRRQRSVCLSANRGRVSLLGAGRGLYSAPKANRWEEVRGARAGLSIKRPSPRPKAAPADFLPSGSHESLGKLSLFSLGGVVSYSNAPQNPPGWMCPRKLLNRVGAVSSEVAIALADGISPPEQARTLGRGDHWPSRVPLAAQPEKTGRHGARRYC